jgi:tRNA G46 methylase TrmB
MHANSRLVTSNQSGIHNHLPALLARHTNTPFKKPVSDVNRQAFTHSIAVWRAAGSAPLIIDAGCGVGLSSLRLADAHPASFVIGIDQSADRLDRNIGWPASRPANCLLVRADLVDYWRLLHEAGIQPQQHYLLYPNPWPKKPQLARRWHGHAIFPTIVALGGKIECRSNWKIYIDEFAAALQQLSGLPVAAEPYQVTDTPLTPFEEKYRASGHDLWCCRTQLSAAFVIP